MPAYSTLKPKGYLPRLADGELERALAIFDAVEVCGPRWCGKSWTATSFSESVTFVDDAPELYASDPSLALLGERPHLMDEWQDVPAIWNVVRHTVDEESQNKGSYILTGSSTPPHPERRHSGAGRIGRVRMRTMTLAETGESSCEVSLRGLFEGRFTPARRPSGLMEIAHAICRGGWPEIIANGSVHSLPIIDDYLELLFDVSLAREGLSPMKSRQVARALARNDATSAKLATLASDAFAEEIEMTGGARQPSKQTVATYLEAMTRNYVITELPGWDAPIRSVSRLRTRPKRYLDDPSLAARLLGVDEEALIRDGQLLGLLFENLCVHELAVYASLLPEAGRQPLRYYADADGLEVDVIIELMDGRWAGIEIKLGEAKVAEGVRNLKRLRRKIALNPAARNPKPVFMAVLLGAGEIARYQPDDDVYVIPIGALGP